MDRGLRVIAHVGALSIPFLFLGFFLLLPLGVALLSVQSRSGWEWVLFSPYVASKMRGALLQALLSTLLAMGAALSLSWMYHRFEIRGGGLHLALHSSVFVLPVFVVVFGIQGIAGKGGGIEEILGWAPLSFLSPWTGVILAHAYYNYGFAARILHTVWNRRPRTLEEQSRTLGASPWESFRRVTLPILGPSILAVALLVFLFTWTSFGVVLYMGEGIVETPETLIYANLVGAFPSYDRAGALSLLQYGILILILLGVSLLERTAPPAPRVLPKGIPPGRGIVLLAWALLAVPLLPPLSVLLWSFRIRGEWSLEGWKALFSPSNPHHLGGFDFERALALSLVYGIGTLLLSLTLSLLWVYGLRSLRRKLRTFLLGVGILPLSTSGVLLGFSYLVAFGAGGIVDLRGSAPLIVVAHTLLSFPFVLRVVHPALEAHDTRLDDAARLLGAGPFEVLRRVHLPLLLPTLLVAGGTAFAMSLGDFGASLILMRPDTMGISVWISRHGGVSAFDPLLRAQALALTTILLLLVTLLFVATEAIGRRRFR